MRVLVECLLASFLFFSTIFVVPSFGGTNLQLSSKSPNNNDCSGSEQIDSAGENGVSIKLRSYTYFNEPSSDDHWSKKIDDWRKRSLEQGDVTETHNTNIAYFFRRTHNDIARYAQEDELNHLGIADEISLRIRGTLTKKFYIPDISFDYWPTINELLASNGDDCDGLELIIFYTLKKLRFPEHTVYRSIIHRTTDNSYHMVTFWFEDKDDPWVIDPTGSATCELKKMSKLFEWVPLYIFSLHDFFVVEEVKEPHDVSSK